MLARLSWAVVCVVLWRPYYVALFVRWLIPWPPWPLDRACAADERLWTAFRHPPYIEHLRG